ncbi:MAG: phenylalanine--tRNA ligase subunit alpha [Holosporaceae bacterium]|nr:phenylalanine--tRNA ligase subunit alpha [Holosporaceae bacterium]
MVSELDRLRASCLYEISNCDSLRRLDMLKNVLFGKSGKITEMMKKLPTLKDEQKRTLGAEINALKNEVTQKINAKFEELEMKELDKKLASEFIDVSMPPRPCNFGKIHPITKVEEEISDIFSSYGFKFADGPDIENEYFNFTVMNMPDHHPARTMHDTFYVHRLADENGRKLLRTHTSTVQMHAMRAYTPPFRFFSFGRVYRSDYDATHTPMFNQIEGIIVDEGVGFAHLKWLMSDFLKKFFEAKDLRIRFRPSFFPFTEPSAEIDVAYEIRGGKMMLGTGNNWLEVVGCGVIHPNVLEHGKTDRSKYQGIAFGFGVERLTSLKYGIPDLRGYFESGERWINAFGFSHSAK